ncbi:MAG TPA: hypothetical protein VHY22_18170 [Chthoniobacteraceae bacterium]|jgi:hypothetical protein|nr:hypothetical protein [Chthoniobacteraceae bacterium]
MRKYISDRPWIWIVVGYIFMTTSLITLVVIAEKYEQPSVPLHHGAAVDDH